MFTEPRPQDEAGQHGSQTLQQQQQNYAAGLEMYTIVGSTAERATAPFWRRSVRQVWRDRGHAGIYIPAAALFTLWAWWNLYYYPSLGQWWSFVATLMMVAANTSWLVLMLTFGKVRGVMHERE